MKRSSLTHRTFAALAALATLSGAAVIGCADEPPQQIKPQGTPIDDPTNAIPEGEAPYSAGADNTHDHFNDLGANGARDPFDILAQRQEEGPPEIRTRLHSCQKLQIAAVRSLLSSFGVNLDATGDPAPAGQLLATGTGALGSANYDARVGETIVWSSAGAAKLFDIFVQAAPEIIANMETSDQCQLNGAGVKMFDDANQCNKDAISCLIGKPATPDHVALCSNVVKSASSAEKGRNIAVATMLSAAFSCE
ncbi:MAG: hypothetical protein HUU21_27110 [Polyangiaceae bacterium]|nr:hypothetical protein [Polyangiaceae bacterium]